MSPALRIAVTLGLVAGVLWWIGDAQQNGLEKIASVLAGTDPRLVALVFALATLDRVLMVVKWQRLLASRGLALGFVRGMDFYCTSLLWGLFLPSTVGADALRAAMTVRAGLRRDDVVASIVVERMIGFLCSLVASLGGLLLLSALADLPERWRSLWWIGSLVLAGGVAAVGLSLSRRAFDLVVDALPARIRELRLVRALQRLHGVYVAFYADARTIAVFTALTLLEIGVSILYCWSTALALGVDVSLPFVAGALPLAILMARLPLSIDGIGVFEAAFAGLLLLAGVPEQEAISMALLGRVVQIAAWLPWWLHHYGVTRELRPSEVAEAAGAADGEERSDSRPGSR